MSDLDTLRLVRGAYIRWVIAQQEAEQEAQERDRFAAVAAHHGLSLARIAAELGVSRARVGQYVAAHKKRQNQQ